MNAKKTLQIALFLLVVAGAAVGIYLRFFGQPTTPVEVTPSTNEAPTGTGLPSAGESATKAPTAGVTRLPGGQPLAPSGEVTQPETTQVETVAKGGVTVTTPVVAAPTSGAVVSSSGDLNFYNRNDGKVYRVGADGTARTLSNKQFFNVDKVSFNSSGDKAIMTYPDGAKVVFDFTTNSQVTMPSHWNDLSWSADGDKIVAKSLGTDVDSRFLVVTSPDGTSAKAIQELGSNGDKVTVAWSPNNQVVAFSATGEPCGFSCSELFLIGQNKENFKTLDVPGLGFIPKWTPQGNQLMFSVANEGSDWKPQLWLVDADGNNVGKNRHSINVNTWADKCTFADDKTAVCAVPRSLPRGAGLNRRVAENEPDDLYQINIETGVFKRLAIPEGQHTMTNLTVAKDGSKVYFSDSSSEFLYSVQLK